MKKIVYLILMLCLGTTAFALYDEPVKFLQVFTNNGKDIIEKPHLVDSVTYSKYDLDSVLHDDYVTQVIWAKDTVYRSSLTSVDSLTIDKNEYYLYCMSLREFIDSNIKEGDSKESVRSKIDNYLGSCDYVTDFSFDETYEFYTVSFNNGLQAGVSFLNMEEFLPEENSASNSPQRKTLGSDTKEFFDVSYVEGERIQENNKMLYLWAGEFCILETFNPDREIDEINEIIEESPLNIEVDVVKDDLSILDRFNNYGAILIAQTHGFGGGTFCLCSKSWTNRFGVKDKIPLTFDDFINFRIGKIMDRIDMNFDWYYYIIKPDYFKSTKFDNPFIYGNYCWSLGLASEIKDCCFVGYDVKSNFIKNVDNSTSYFKSLFVNGATHGKAVDDIEGYMMYSWDGEPTNWLSAETNTDCEHNQRYFSIKTDDITEYTESGHPIITGKINGFKNLKKEGITYKIYYKKGDNKILNPGDEGVESFLIDANAIDIDGNIRCELLNLNPDINYTATIGFEYNKKCYYGSIKDIIHKEVQLCPDENHPHLIDMGTGVLWSCCNIGSSYPYEVGDYYSWGETKTKTDYSYYDNYEIQHNIRFPGNISQTSHDVAWEKSGNQLRMPSKKEFEGLVNNCDVIWDHNHSGAILTSRINGNKLFIPAGGWIFQGEHMGQGDCGILWSGNRDSGSPFSWFMQAIYDNGNPNIHLAASRYSGHNVRGIK